MKVELDKKRRGKASILAGSVWVVTYLGCLYTLQNFEVIRPLNIVLAILPALTFAVFVYFYIRGIDAMDEMQQRIQLEAVMIGFALSLLTLMLLALLHMAIDFTYDWNSHLHLLLYFILFYYIGMVISKKRYTANEKQPEN